MNFDIAAWRTQLRSFYEGLEKKQRRNLWFILVFFLATVVALTLFFSNPNYQVVFSNLDAKSAGEITQKLDQLKIPYQLQGTNVLVPASQADQVRVDMAMQGLPSSGTVDYSQIFQQSSVFSLSSQELNLEELSVLQQRIAQSIDLINGIQSSEVTVVPAQQSSFLVSSTNSSAKATVVLTLGAGSALTPQQVFGIQQLVAHSVQGLNSADVVVVDQNGNDLASSASSNSTMAGGSSLATSELAMQQQLEQAAQTQLQSSLSQMVGLGNVQVIVHASVTFNQVTRNQHQVTAGPPLSAQASQQSSTGASTATTGGTAGQATQNPNIVTYGSTGTGNGGSSSSRSSTTNYDNNYVNTSTTYDPMQVNGYTVSVLINSKAMTLTPSLRSAIQSYVLTAIGQRGTTVKAPSVTVLSAPFTSAVTVPATTSSFLGGPLGIGGAVALLLAVGAISLVWLRSRNKKRVTKDALGSLSAAAMASPPPEPEEVTLTKQLQEMALRRPESFAGLVRSWISEE